jgi:hypothetical protein
MDRINRVPASAGAEWIMGGFRLLRAAPLGLGVLGAIFGALGLVANIAMQGGALTLAMLLQLAFILIGPLLLAGMMVAAREVDEGRGASPMHLLRGLQDGKAPRLLATLLPQIAAMVLALVLLFVLVGPAQLEQFALAMQKMQGQAQPDPSVIADLPVGRLFLWMLLVLVIGVTAGFFNFTALPEMMFTDRGPLAAMRQSFQACVRNLPALLVFFLLLVIAAVGLNFAVLIVAAVVGAVLGAAAMQLVVQVLVMAVLMPVVTGAMYIAWKQLHGAEAPAPAVLPATHFEA